MIDATTDFDIQNQRKYKEVSFIRNTSVVDRNIVIQYNNSIAIVPLIFITATDSLSGSVLLGTMPDEIDGYYEVGLVMVETSPSCVVYNPIDKTITLLLSSALTAKTWVQGQLVIPLR